jgi:TRAP-type transport system periplasmic protein
MPIRTLAATAVLVSFAVGAQDLPKTQFKVIGLNAPTVASIVDEVPFWRETLPKASKGAISADITPLDQMGIDDKTMLRLLRLGVMDFAGMDISKMAGDDPRFEGCDLAGITLDPDKAGLPRRDRPADAEELEREAARLRRQPAAGVLVPRRARRPV